MAANQVLHIKQDKKGNIWFGTFFGISKFDGLKFKNFTKIDTTKIERARFFFVDSQDNIWAGITAGLCRINTNDKVQLFNQTADGKSFNRVWAIDEYRPSQLLVTNTYNTYLFDGKTFHEIKYPSGKPVAATIFYKFQGKELIGTYHEGIHYYENGQVKTFAQDTLINKTAFYQFATDNQGRLWAATSRGTIVFDSPERYFVLNKKNYLPDDISLGITKDSEGNMWITTPEGLVQCKPGFIDIYNRKNGLFDDVLTSLNRDNEGNIYFGGMEGRISAWKDGHFFYPIPASIIADRVVGMVKKDQTNHIWFSEEDRRLFRIKGNKIEDMGKKFQFKPPHFVSSMLEDTIKKIFWMGDRGLLYRYDGNKVETFGTKDSLFVDDILVLYLDKWERLWIGTKGLWMYDGQHFKDYSKISQTEGVFLQAIKPDAQGNIWVATIGKGLSKMHFDQHHELVLDEQITSKNGLPNPNLLDIEFDNEGQLWVGSFGGILRININAPKINGLYPIRIFEKNDGIIENMWRNAPLIKDNDGNIWAGTSGGAMRFRVKDLYKNSVPPKVNISQLQVVESTGDSTQKITQLIDNQSFNRNQNFLTFYFDGISLSNPENIYYSYTLEGLDEKWSTLTQQNNANYPKLSSGSYTFKVKAMNSDGVWSEEKSFRFSIKAPFWQTWWFRGFLVLILAGIIYGFLKIRERTLNEKNQTALRMAELQLKAVQSQMNPHFLFNSLNSVQNYIISNRPMEGARYLSKFSKLVRRILENSNYQYMRLEDIIETLQMYVEIESFRFNNEFSYEFKVEENEDVREMLLPPMLFQPYVENAIWHGLMPKEGKKKLLIEIKEENKWLHCRIEDNGVGRQANLPRQEGHISRGQQIIKTIFDTMQQQGKAATIDIIDLFDKHQQAAGTRVDMWIPVD